MPYFPRDYSKSFVSNLRIRDKNEANGRQAAAQEDGVLDEVVRRLVAAYDPLQVYLFGSKARGDAGPDSDYDLLLVVPDDASSELRRSRLAYETLWGTRAAADVLVCTQSYFEPRRFLKASLPGTILRECQFA